MLKLLINIWLIGSDRKCTQAKYHENKEVDYLLVHTESKEKCFFNSIPIKSGIINRLKHLRKQELTESNRRRSPAEMEQIKKRSEALKRAREFDEAARKGSGKWE